MHFLLGDRSPPVSIRPKESGSSPSFTSKSRPTRSCLPAITMRHVKNCSPPSCASMPTHASSPPLDCSRVQPANPEGRETLLSQSSSRPCRSTRSLPLSRPRKTHRPAHRSLRIACGGVDNVSAHSLAGRPRKPCGESRLVRKQRPFHNRGTAHRFTRLYRLTPTTGTSYEANRHF